MYCTSQLLNHSTTQPRNHPTTQPLNHPTTQPPNHQTATEGFGNFPAAGNEEGSYDLALSWLPDLAMLTQLGAPAIFTCANDFADAEGEVSSRAMP